MSEPRDLRELLGDDVPEDELRRLASVDALLHSVPAPPAHVPESLTVRVRRTAFAGPRWSRRRLVAGLAFAAALAALAFGVGRWTSGDTDDLAARAVVPMERTASAPADAWAVIKLGRRDAASGNWEFELDIGGLPRLAGNGYYALWLEKDGEWAATCGTFNVDTTNETIVRMTAAYRLRNYDAWVVSAIRPDQPQDAEPPSVLRAAIT